MIVSRRLYTTTCSAGLLAAIALGSTFAPVRGIVDARGVTPALPGSVAKQPRSAAASAAKPVPAHANSAPATKPAAHPANATDPRAMFEGLGAWIDLYDFEMNPRTVTTMLARNGVKTLYLQTGRSNTKHGVHPAVGRWLVEAHHVGLKVVGWYLPFYRTVRRDFQRTMAIKYYRYGEHRFDGLGVDIEFRPHGLSRKKWNRNVGTISKLVYQAAKGFPVAAIPPPPLQMQVATSHWAGFPWGTVGRNADSVMLMSYWSDRRGCPEVRLFCAYEYTAANVRLARMLVGQKPSLHIIGGIGNAMSDRDLGAFIRAARASGADGASIYDVATMRRSWWPKLKSLASLGR